MSDRILHTLWTKAAGTPSYEKGEWFALESQLKRLAAAEALLRDARDAWSPGDGGGCGCQDCRLDDCIRAFLAPPAPQPERSCGTEGGS